MMSRADLLALSPDDLAALTNRGTLKRAQRELAGDELKAEITEDEERLVISWTDGIVCTFPAGETIHEAQCSSGTLGISRHIVRSVLAYQQYAQNADPGDSKRQTKESSDAEADQAGVWNPGDITDEQLEQQFRKAAVTLARKLFDTGVLVELTRGTKPVARFLHESCTIRFPVPGDVRYATGDCSESILPQWVMLAVWSFREFPPEKTAGLLSLQQSQLPTPTDDLETLDQLLLELAADGFAALSATWPQRLSRLEKRIRAAGLVWPAELMLELLLQHERYQTHDARFEPGELVRLTGELVARGRAIRSQNGSVPQPLIRGTKSDRATEISKGRFVGVGMQVKPGRQHVTINAYWQNIDSGSVVTIERTFNDPKADSIETPKSFDDLATHALARSVSLGASGAVAGSARIRQTHTNQRTRPASWCRQTDGESAGFPVGASAGTVCRRKLHSFA